MVNAAGTGYRLAAARLMFWFMNATNEPSATTPRLATAATTWRVDPIHTTVGFGIRHLMVTPSAACSSGSPAPCATHRTSILLEAGGIAVADEVALTIELSLVENLAG
jgi:hypothetical protein